MGESKDIKSKFIKVGRFLTALFVLKRPNRNSTEKRALDDDFVALRTSNNISKQSSFEKEQNKDRYVCRGGVKWSRCQSTPNLGNMSKEQPHELKQPRQTDIGAILKNERKESTKARPSSASRPHFRQFGRQARMGDYSSRTFVDTADHVAKKKNSGGSSMRKNQSSHHLMPESTNADMRLSARSLLVPPVSSSMMMSRSGSRVSLRSNRSTKSSCNAKPRLRKKSKPSRSSFYATETRLK